MTSKSGGKRKDLQGLYLGWEMMYLLLPHFEMLWLFLNHVPNNKDAYVDLLISAIRQQFYPRAD